MSLSQYKLMEKGFGMTVSFLILPSSGSLRGVRWFDTDVSRLPVGSFFEGQVVQEEGQL